MKNIALMIALLLSVGVFAGCSQQAEPVVEETPVMIQEESTQEMVIEEDTAMESDEYVIDETSTEVMEKEVAE